MANTKKKKHGSGKPNPRNVPCSEADCRKAYVEGVDDGMNHLMEMVLFNLLDKHGATKEELQTLADEVDDLADYIRRGIIKWEDITKALYDEFNLEVHIS